MHIPVTRSGCGLSASAAHVPIGPKIPLVAKLFARLKRKIKMPVLGLAGGAEGLIGVKLQLLDLVKVRPVNNKMPVTRMISV